MDTRWEGGRAEKQRTWGSQGGFWSAAGGVSLLCFSQKLELGASASVAKSLFHWLRGRFMMLKRMLRIQFL